MANYYTSTIQKGSKGDDVTKWQEFLKAGGFYTGAIDGDFGSLTDSATRAYQTANGLGVDGIVGDQTWGKAGFITYNGTPSVLPETDTTKWDESEEGQKASEAYGDAKVAVDNFNPYTFTEYTKGEDVLAAEGTYNDHLANKPGEYSSQWLSQVDALMKQIMNRDKFSYNMNEDALYQQYKDNYIQQGKLAMADAMGQASAMTGGYGSSYSQSVGQQAYQGQLQNLNDILPELYQMALDRYKQEGQDFYNQYGLLMDRENTDYGRYMDALNTWMTDRDFLAGRVDSALNFDYGQHMDAEGIKHTMSQEEYGRLMDALGIARGDYYDGADIFHTEQNTTNTELWNRYYAQEDVRQDNNDDYFTMVDDERTDERNAVEDEHWEEEHELDVNADERAEEEHDAIMSDYNDNNKSYSGTLSNGTMFNNGDLTDGQIKALQAALGITADGKYGPRTKEAAGGLSAEEAYAKYVDSSGNDNNSNKGTTPSGVAYDNGSVSDANIKKMQEALGVGADGYWGPKSTEAAGGMTADEAWEAYQNGTLGNKEPTTITPTESENTTSFIDSHMTLEQFLQQGGTSKTPSLRGGGGSSYAEYKEYIAAELEKNWGMWSDEEKAYIIEYYKL